MVRSRDIVSSTLVLATLSGLAFAGPLTPPAGAVASTYKTLTEVEPRTLINAANTPGDANSVYHITAPGSYYLGGNLASVSGKHGIKIDADNVTIDLNGYTLQGATGSLDGINSPVARRSLSVRNGTVRSWAGSGIYNSPSDSGRFADLVIANNTLDGLWTGGGAIVENVECVSNRSGFIIGGSGNIIRNCSALGNAQIGFEGSGAAESSFTSCIARQNGNDGFRAGPGWTIEHCTSALNTIGFIVGTRSVLQNNSANANRADGFSLGNAGIVDGCQSAVNAGKGFNVGGQSTLNRCDAYQNTGDNFSISDDSMLANSVSQGSGARGVVLGARCALSSSVVTFNASSGVLLNASNSSVRGCTVSQNSSGIIAAATQGGFVIESNVASNNSGRGIFAGLGSRVASNSVRNNTLDGIAVDSGCLVVSNQVDTNGSAVGSQGGIFAQSGGNSITDNFLISNDIQIYTLGSPNTILRNSCRTAISANYSISAGDAGNVIGARIGSGNAAVNTNPNANVDN